MLLNNKTIISQPAAEEDDEEEYSLLCKYNDEVRHKSISKSKDKSKGHSVFLLHGGLSDRQLN